MFNLASLDPIASHRTAENTQTYMLYGRIGLDISKNTTTTRAPCGAKNPAKRHSVLVILLNVFRLGLFNTPTNIKRR